jgi:hypothetical protein
MAPKKKKIDIAPASLEPVDEFVMLTVARAQIDRVFDDCSADIEKIIDAHSTTPGAAVTILQHLNAVRQMARACLDK